MIHRKASGDQESCALWRNYITGTASRHAEPMEANQVIRGCKIGEVFIGWKWHGETTAIENPWCYLQLKRSIRIPTQYDQIEFSERNKEFDQPIHHVVARDGIILKDHETFRLTGALLPKRQVGHRATDRAGAVDCVLRDDTAYDLGHVDVPAVDAFKVLKINLVIRIEPAEFLQPFRLALQADNEAFEHIFEPHFWPPAG